MKEDKDKLDRELILRSIFKKWNPICLGCHRDQGSRDCPLCQKYRRGGDYISKCLACPISLKVGYLDCCDTPYEGYSHAYPPESHDFAEEEVEFLISLLDGETQENLEEIFIKWCKEDTL